MNADGELQAAIIAALTAESGGLMAAVGDRVYDNPPEGVAFPYVSFGPSDAQPQYMDCVTAADASLQIDVWTREGGALSGCRAIVGAIVDVINAMGRAGADQYGFASIMVERTRVFRDPDGLTAHGVVQVTAEITRA